MSDFLERLLFSLKKSVDSDLSCLVKFDQNSYSLNKSVYSNQLNFNIASILESCKSIEFKRIQELLDAENNFASSIYHSFVAENSQYIVYSASNTDQNFEKNNNLIHAEITKIIETTLNVINSGFQKPLTKEKTIHLFAEASNELIFTLDHYGTFNFVNKYGLEKLKYSREEIIGQHFYQFISEDYKHNTGEAFQKIIKEKDQSNFKTEILPKVGMEQLFEIKLIPIFNEGNLEELIGVGSNISEQKIEKNRNSELLAKLKEANRINAIERDRAKQQISILNELNNLKNEFISNVSHELRTPLASIIGFSETILEDNNLTVERAKEFSEVILTESKRLAKLINDVLDFSELESERQKLQKNTINIITTLKEIIENFKDECAKKNITLTSKLPESEITIYADQERIQKAFSYLMSNAVKFTNEKGRITLIAQEFLKEVEIVISDTGIGISEDKISLLFDKFSKLKRAGINTLPGAGFGLVTVKQIIDLHKGLIRVKSEVDKGTSFIIRLPKYSFN